MKKTSLLALAFLFSMNAFSQEDAAIQKWQSAHPTTLLISAARYASLSDEEKALIGTDYILFEDKVTVELLEKFDQQKGIETTTTFKEEQQQEVKNWLSTHPEVKIIRRSTFDAFAPERQQYCAERPLEILVLEGESITIKDIENYGH